MFAGVSALTRAQSGRELPNARVISLQLFPDKQLVDPIWNLNTQQWGQIITHDMSLTAGVVQSRKFPHYITSFATIFFPLHTLGLKGDWCTFTLGLPDFVQTMLLSVNFCDVSEMGNNKLVICSTI